MAYDVLVIGARCGGAPTAMLLARKGYRVLLLDRVTFPSDTISTHIVKYPGVVRLRRWNLLDPVLASGCPPIHRFTSDLGDGKLSAIAHPLDDIPSIAPRRTVLDKILVDAAAEAGVEVRGGFSVRRILMDEERVTGLEGRDEEGKMASETAHVTIGADGKHSLLARTVRAPKYHEHPALAFYYFTYWPDLPIDGLELNWRHERFVLAFPTNDDLSCLMVGWPRHQFREFRKDTQRNYLETLEIAPHIAQAVRQSRPAQRLKGMADLPNFFRKPYGPGWALVGDAGLMKDPFDGQGIMDAFRDAELLSGSIDAGLSGRQPLQEALAEYEQKRNDATLSAYEQNLRGARLVDLDSPERLQLRDALRDDTAEASRYYGEWAHSL